ncbi:MAG: AAA family ATPase [Proteobacteria bacterium]|nr:AAA family ATPase [Pseudomonadota bacterium]
MSAGRTPPAAMTLVLELAAAPRLSIGDGEAIALAPLDAALLVWLALEGATPRARIAQLLWPEKHADAARNSLRQRLFQLRRQAGVELVTGSATLSLADGVSHDLEDADTVLGHPDGDDLPAGEFAAWLGMQRLRRRDRVRRALTELADRAEAVRDWDDALTHARELVALEPLSEESHRRVMRLHYLAGDRAAALLAFDRCEQLLKHEVGTAPSDDTLALLRTVQAAANAADEAAGPAVLAVAPRIPASVLRPPRLIGRDAAWAQLAEAWHAGGCAIVVGEAGLGKSRLAGDFAQSQGRALLAGARPGDARVVYASASRLLRALPRAALDAADAGTRQELARLLPELGQPAPIASDTERTRFFNAVAAVLDAQSPHVDGIVFDDLHFADDASIELLQYVSSSSALRWLIAARGAEVTETGRALLDGFDARGAGAVRVELLPFDVSQIEAFVDSLGLPGVDAAQLAPALARHTGGNPMFLLETLKAWMAAGLPGLPGLSGLKAPVRLPAARGVTQLIEQRIGRLSVQAVQLARCAAVAAPDFSIELASQVLGLRTLELADPWAELEAAQVLRDGVFAHDLIYESALASVPRAVARRLHAEIAGYLDAHGGEAARVAAHWIEAGDDAHALDALRRAAAQARAAGRKREEIDALERASGIAERLGASGVAFDCQAAIFDSLMIVDRSRLDEAFMSRLEQLADGPGQRLDALLKRADLAKCTGRYAEGSALAEAAAEMARGLGRQKEEVEALRGAAACASFAGDSQRAVRLLRPALPWILEQGDGQDRQSYFNDLACTLDNADQPLEAQQYHRRALDAAIELGRLDQATIACSNMAYSLKNVGRLRAALEQTQQGRRYALGFDDARSTTLALDVMTLPLLRDLARYGEALHASEVALQAGAQFAEARITVELHLALLWLRLGQPARAQQRLAAVQAQPVPPRLRARVAQLAGQLCQALGQPAAGHFEQALADAPALGRTTPQSMIVLDHAHTLPPAAALAACEQVRQRAEAIGLAGVALAARVRGAWFAARAGAVQRAAALAREALEASPDIEADELYPAERWRNAALAFEAAGAPDEARAAAQAGRDWVLRVAEEQVPPSFRDGFVHRHPVNQELLALAGRLRSGPAM